MAESVGPLFSIAVVLLKFEEVAKLGDGLRSFGHQGFSCQTERAAYGAMRAARDNDHDSSRGVSAKPAHQS